MYDGGVGEELATGVRDRASAARTLPEPGEGDEFGRFVRKARLGEGGMGVVYLARDPRLERDVALKVLRSKRPGAGDTEHRARLFREAQALAQLSHPGVVQVFEVGEVEGTIYIAMEYVPGKTLRQWRVGDDPTPAEILAALVAAGEGLAAVHDAGLLHRDVKPGNILVGDDGRTRLADFGLAKADTAEPSARTDTDQDVASEHSGNPLASPMTRGNRVVGTPAYIAPELHHASTPTAASDQFAFCVTAYEMLGGRRPFSGSTLAALTANMVCGRVTAPRTPIANGTLRVLLRGLSVDPQERYPSMAALLQDLAAAQRRPRVRLGVAVGGVLLAGGVAALLVPAGTRCESGDTRVAAAWSTARADRIRESLVATDKAYAPTVAASISDALDERAEGWVTAYTEACEADDPEVLDRRMLCLNRRLDELDAAANVVEEAGGELVGDAQKLAAVLDTVVDAEVCLRDDSTEPQPADPQTAARVAVARNRLVASRASENAGRYLAAEDLANEALKEARELGFAPLEAEALHALAQVASQRGGWEGAAKLLREAALLAEAHHHDRMAARSWVDLVLVEGHFLRRPDDAERSAVAAKAALDRLGETARLQALLLGNEAAVSAAAGELELALAKQRASLALREKLMGEDAFDVGVTCNSVAMTLARLGRYAEARPFFDRSLAIVKGKFGDRHPAVGSILTNLANLLERSNETPAALDARREALSIFEEALPPDSPAIGIGYNSLAITLDDAGHPEEALAASRRALEIRKKSLGPDHPDYPGSLSTTAGILRSLGRFDEAIALSREAVDTMAAIRGHDSFDTGRMRLGHAASLRGVGRGEDAAREGKLALAAYEETFPANHARLVDPLRGLGQSYLAANQPEAALTHLIRALGIIESDGEIAPLKQSTVRFTYAKALAATGDRKRAREFAQRARHDALRSSVSVDERLAEIDAFLTDDGTSRGRVETGR